MRDVLIIDGYNIIGAWGELRKLVKQDGLEEARDLLIEKLIEYQASTGREVYIVFDAYKVPGIRQQYTQKQLHILYTKQDETADELIEKMVRVSEKYTSQIYVATSDFTEQQITFGDGALRITARELIQEIDRVKKKVRERVAKMEQQPKRTLGDALDPGISKIFEIWRRK
ncbi:NYN domain-containing protein [Fodinisporobacter ferrooxydans]|uniref:NYN domain-containing protein n=1 Tax=Fodinisporobacter ferrooxydans TaxID=2901836 RepID=A0ABY4CVH3_9BACL|nr:NYN domain-containing protein [Alicyclobacillaceae bacterium MYW30-H2]